MQETKVQALGRVDPLDKQMATHSSILAWRNPRDRQAWSATVHGLIRVGYNLASKPQEEVLGGVLSLAEAGLA